MKHHQNFLIPGFFILFFVLPSGRNPYLSAQSNIAVHTELNCEAPGTPDQTQFCLSQDLAKTDEELKKAFAIPTLPLVMISYSQEQWTQDRDQRCKKKKQEPIHGEIRFMHCQLKENQIQIWRMTSNFDRIAGSMRRALRAKAKSYAFPEPFKNVTLGKPEDFVSSSAPDPIECFPLAINGKVKIWVNDFYLPQKERKLIVRRCEKYKVSPTELKNISSGMHYGGSASDEKGPFYEVLTINSHDDFVSQKINLPLNSWVSNLTFLGSKIAYYGVEGELGKNTLCYGMVYDYSAAKTLKQEKLGPCELGTDNEGYFPYPEWSLDGSEVIFDFSPEKGGKVKLKVQ